jgi:hypothetical protein
VDGPRCAQQAGPQLRSRATAMPNPCAATDEEQAQEGCEPRDELRRLHGIRKKLKIGKAGVTEGIVNGIHERWRSGGTRRP